jgi:hypothetical protein
MRPIVLCLAAAFLLTIAASAHAASISIEHTSVCVQSICDFGTTNAALPNAAAPAPISIFTSGIDTGARLNSMQVCLSIDPACTTLGTTPIGLISNIRFTNVSLVCPAAGPNCTPFGLGFTFSGHLDGSVVFDFLLNDVSVALPAGAFISGNMALELIVDRVSTTSFLTFDTRSGSTFGPVAPIIVGGSVVPYSAFGTLIVNGMPAGSELKISNSGDFRFAEAVPESSTLAFSLIALAGLWRLKERIGRSPKKS